MRFLLCSSMLVVLTLTVSDFAQAMDASPHIFYERQPDGTLIALQEKGNEMEHWVTDLEDYTVMANDDGYFVYAEEGDDGALHTTNERVGRASPRSIGMKKGARNHAAKNCFKQICGGIPHSMSLEVDMNCEDKNCGKRGKGGRHLLDNDPGPEVHNRRTIETTGTLNNLVVLLNFKNHEQDGRTLPSVADIEILMNNDDIHPLCPTGSVKRVYEEISYGQLTIDSTVTPWFSTSRDEEWYADGRSGSTNLHEAIREALDYLDDNDIVDFDEFDQDGDGYIDAITILHSGYAAEWGGRDCDGAATADRIWSHKWKLWSDSSGRFVGPWVSSNGRVKVWDYHISPALWDTCGDDIGRVGVIAHETGHFLGLPDFYDTDGGGRGLGAYDMMSSSWGFDGSQHYPGHMSAYSKVQMEWVQPIVPGYGVNFVFNLEEQSTEPQVYKIGDGRYGFDQGEYLLIENRQKKGLDAILPRGGLAIYHVDERADLNTEGHPGQNGWPQNGNHYKVALLQADGFYNLERGDNIGGTRDFFHADDVDRLMPSLNDPNDGPFPNTDTYGRGRLEKTNIEITDISVSGDVMSFAFSDGTVEAAFDLATPAPITKAPTPQPSAAPSKFPTRSPSVAPSKSPTFSPSASSPPSTSSSPSVPASPSVSTEPSSIPTQGPSSYPSSPPSKIFSESPSYSPTASPTESPTTCLAKKEECEEDDQCCNNKCKKGECK